MRTIISIENTDYVLFVFSKLRIKSGLGTRAYFIPIKIANSLNVSSYDGKELYGDEDIFDEIEKYEIDHFRAYQCN